PEGVTSPEDYIDKVAGMLSATSEKASRQTAGISMPYVIGTLANSAENGIFYGCLATGDDGLILFTVRCENFGQSLDRALLNVFFDHIDRISD
ncbi:MAG: hypothetical protein K8F91_05470, partial [Candidatus Obscuribacterales bacterium]|nr:hypothetical protein [Candidatus Obscuribacterales bacterium]